jgi:hypothetical protein
VFRFEFDGWEVAVDLERAVAVEPSTQCEVPASWCSRFVSGQSPPLDRRGSAKRRHARHRPNRRSPQGKENLSHDAKDVLVVLGDEQGDRQV